MSDVIEAKVKLRDIAHELDKRSRELGDTNRALHPVQEAYDDFMRDFKAGLYQECESKQRRMPSKETQEDLALEQMPKDFRGKHHELVSKRKRLKERISDLKAEADAWRSVLSAEKVELEALA